MMRAAITRSESLSIREMAAADVGPCVQVRARTREQRWTPDALTAAGITEPAVVGLLATTHKGWVCEHDGQVVGFSIGDRSTGELWVVADPPEHEGRGIGRRLVEHAQRWLHAEGWDEIWLRTSPDTSTRAHGLYSALGWRDCGVKDGQFVMRHGGARRDVNATTE